MYMVSTAVVCCFQDVLLVCGHGVVWRLAEGGGQLQAGGQRLDRVRGQLTGETCTAVTHKLQTFKCGMLCLQPFVYSFIILFHGYVIM
jgi:hypothetical protein